jgi:hypothetical protein
LVPERSACAHSCKPPCSLLCLPSHQPGLTRHCQSMHFIVMFKHFSGALEHWSAAGRSAPSGATLDPPAAASKYAPLQRHKHVGRLGKPFDRRQAPMHLSALSIDRSASLEHKRPPWAAVSAFSSFLSPFHRLTTM